MDEWIHASSWEWSCYKAQLFPYICSFLPLIPITLQHKNIDQVLSVSFMQRHTSQFPKLWTKYLFFINHRVSSICLTVTGNRQALNSVLFPCRGNLRSNNVLIHGFHRTSVSCQEKSIREARSFFLDAVSKGINPTVVVCHNERVPS